MSERGLAILRERAGAEVMERLEHLDAVRARPAPDRVLRAPDRDASVDTDVVFLGGGLSLLVAAEVARLGRRVVVLERARAGAAHREWNASWPELAPLVTAGIVSQPELEELVLARYERGVCRFHGSAPSIVRGVLDHAVDAGALLARVRDVARARGVRFVDRASVEGLGAGTDSVRVAYAGGEIVARVAVDARGAASPYAAADLVCPTVGGVMKGLDVDPMQGDILVTTEHADRGRQHVWEGFPGRPGEVTVYLFYYARKEAAGSLSGLYARFFETLGQYASGAPELLRPTFGYIPGWSRLTPAPRAPHPRVILVGDAAARHSPLTFCGFGSMLRTFERVAAHVAGLAGGPLDEPIHAWTGVLARLMASESLMGSSLNELLGAAFASLAEQGNEAFASLLQDRMTAPDLVRFLRRTAERRPAVYRDVLRALGPRALARWGFSVARSRVAELA